MYLSSLSLESPSLSPASLPSTSISEASIFDKSTSRIASRSPPVLMLASVKMPSSSGRSTARFSMPIATRERSRDAASRSFFRCRFLCANAFSLKKTTIRNKKIGRKWTRYEPGATTHTHPTTQTRSRGRGRASSTACGTQHREGLNNTYRRRLKTNVSIQ